jgi:hypothetical protein
MQGAMLATITLSDHTVAMKEESEGFIVGDFEGPYRVSAKILMRKSKLCGIVYHTICKFIFPSNYLV